MFTPQNIIALRAFSDYIATHKFLSFGILLFLSLIAGFADSFDEDKQKRFQSQISTILVPTGSINDRDLYRIIWVSNFPRRIASIDLGRFFHKICTGALEIRDPNDIVHLLTCKTNLEYPVAFEVSFQWRMLVWICQRWFPKSIVKPTVVKKHNVQYGTQFVLDTSSIPHLRFQEYLHTTLIAVPPKSLVLIRTLCKTGGIKNKDDFFLCALPFLPRQHTKSTTDATQGSLTPLLITVDHIVKLLLLNPQDYTIVQIRNDTPAEAQRLEYSVDSLLTNKAVRVWCIQEHGLNGWREHRLCLTWKAALLRAGKLASWHIVLERNG